MLETANMQANCEKCGVCEDREPTIFMVVRQGVRTVKEYVCVTCFEGVQNKMDGCVEAVSLQEWKEIEEKGGENSQ